jgi:hypothetical protein
MIMDGLPTERLQLDHTPALAAFLFQGTTAIRARRRAFDPLDPIGLPGRDAFASMPAVSHLGATHSTLGKNHCRIGFDGQFSRGSGGAKEALLGRAFLITQTILEPSILSPEAINLLLLLQAVRAIAQAMEARVV